MQPLLGGLLRRLRIFRVVDAGAVVVYGRSVCSKAALNARLCEGGYLPLAQSAQSHARGTCPAHETLRIRALQGAWLQDLLARRLREAHPHGAGARLAQLLLLARCCEHVDELHHLQAGHHRVCARHRGDDRSCYGLGVPPGESADAVVLHAQVRRAVHEVHGNRVVLAEDALADEAAARRAVHGGDRLDEAPGVGGHRGHALRVQDGGPRGRAGAVGPLERPVEGQGRRRRALLGPEVLQRRLLLDVVVEEVREDGPAHLRPVHLLL
mmetsp:Transcript_53382/g.155602  ORF Transcript_53382/g.155602 Transcript_53382/m.155602 type:complete len:268 (+) Transcript_53382:399-1202(+)